MDRGKTVENKKYSVVKFLIDDLYSEIPTSWLILDGNKQMCWWPPRTANAAVLISTYSSPNLETWNQYEVDVLKHCCKYLHIDILYMYMYACAFIYVCFCVRNIYILLYEITLSLCKLKLNISFCSCFIIIILFFMHVYRLMFISIFFIKASLESARKSAADSNYQTTDEDTLGRGKRQHTSYSQYSEEEEESDYAPQLCKTKSTYY